MGLRPAKCAIKYNHRGSRAYAWSGIKAVFDIGKMTMVIFVLCAWLHRIGHYGVLDIASPQSGNVGQQPLSSPHFGGTAESSENRCRLRILLWASSQVETLPASVTRESPVFHLRACRIASSEINLGENVSARNT